MKNLDYNRYSEKHCLVNQNDPRLEQRQWSIIRGSERPPPP